MWGNWVTNHANQTSRWSTCSLFWCAQRGPKEMKLHATLKRRSQHAVLNRSPGSFCAVLAILQVEGDPKASGRVSFSTVAVCDSKARAGHGQKRLFGCCWQPGALLGEPRPWEAAASGGELVCGLVLLPLLFLCAHFPGGVWSPLVPLPQPRAHLCSRLRQNATFSSS